MILESGGGGQHCRLQDVRGSAAAGIMPGHRRRVLRSLRHHLAGPGATSTARGSPVAAETSALPPSAQDGRPTAARPAKLDDRAMMKFIQDGYVMLHPDLPADVPSGRDEALVSYNQMICQKVEQLQEQGRDTGNNLLPQLPELMTLFDHPTINGALQSILGEDYYIHLHHATHTKRGIEEGFGQRHHKDSVGNSRICVDSKRRHHRTRWLMLLYFPQDTPVELGPTAIMPGSQYMLRYDMRQHHMDDVQLRDELPCAGPAGTVCIIHYDMLHRAMASKLDQTRHMLKFIICRCARSRCCLFTPTFFQGESTASHSSACRFCIMQDVRANLARTVLGPQPRSSGGAHVARAGSSAEAHPRGALALAPRPRRDPFDVSAIRRWHHRIRRF